MFPKVESFSKIWDECYPIGVPGEYEVNKFYSNSGNLNILIISNRIIICYSYVSARLSNVAVY